MSDDATAPAPDAPVEAAGPRPALDKKKSIIFGIVGLVVILFKGMLTERITAIMARRQGVEL